jgi:hypothetical protein
MGKGCRMMINQTPARNLTDAVCNGIREAKSRQFGGNTPCTGEFTCKWIASHVKDFISQKLTPVMLQTKDQPEMKTALRTFAHELGLGARFEMEESKHE